MPLNFNTGSQFTGSLTTAIKKSNNLRVSIQGDSEIIKASKNATTAMGIGGYGGLESTATGVARSVGWS